MHSSSRPTWGPRPAYAVAPAIAACGIAAWVWSTSRDSQRDSQPTPSAVAITAMKPVDGDVAPAAPLPIEVVYGVPSERTLHLWTAAPAAD